MAVGSIVLAVLAFACIGVGFLLTPVPTVGAAFSFAAPILALVSITMGGLAMSRDKREGGGGDVGRAGVILGVVAFVPALLVALTCGVCNALCSAGEFKTQKQFNFTLGQPGMAGRGLDGGLGRPLGAPAAPARPAAPSPPNGPPSAPTQADPDAPPPAWPPPPMPDHGSGPP